MPSVIFDGAPHDGAPFSFGSDGTLHSTTPRMPERMGAAISVDAKTRPQDLENRTERGFPQRPHASSSSVKKWLRISARSFTSLI